MRHDARVYGGAHFVALAPLGQHVRIAERIGGQPNYEQAAEIKQYLKEIGEHIDQLEAEASMVPRASVLSEASAVSTAVLVW